MYEKARRGESIELAPRRISIFQFDIERSLEDRYLVLLVFSSHMMPLFILESFPMVKL